MVICSSCEFRQYPHPCNVCRILTVLEKLNLLTYRESAPREATDARY